MAKKYFLSNLDVKQEKMKKRMMKRRAEAEEWFGRPKPRGMCPMCYGDHRGAKDGVPSECYAKALKDVSATYEFEVYLKKYRLGKFV